MWNRLILNPKWRRTIWYANEFWVRNLIISWVARRGTLRVLRISEPRYLTSRNTQLVARGFNEIAAARTHADILRFLLAWAHEESTSRHTLVTSQEAKWRRTLGNALVADVQLETKCWTRCFAIRGLSRNGRI